MSKPWRGIHNRFRRYSSVWLSGCRLSARQAAICLDAISQTLKFGASFTARRAARLTLRHDGRWPWRDTRALLKWLVRSFGFVCVDVRPLAVRGNVP